MRHLLPIARRAALLCRDGAANGRIMSSGTTSLTTDTPPIGAALSRLEATVRERLDSGTADTSYVASLAAKGPAKIAQKLGEEAVETVIAALTEDRTALAGEATDLVFHLTVLLAERGLGWDAIAAELDRRDGVSGHAEKAARQS